MHAVIVMCFDADSEGDMEAEQAHAFKAIEKLAGVDYGESRLWSEGESVRLTPSSVLHVIGDDRASDMGLEAIGPGVCPLPRA